MSYSLESLFSLKDQVVAITGGGGILCGEMARALGALGAKVAILDLSEERAQKVADEIKAAGGVAMAVGCSVLEAASMQAAHDRIEQELGPIDALINGAGGNQKNATTGGERIDLPGEPTFFTLDLNAVSGVFSLNFIGTLVPTQVFAAGMAKRGRGNIVNIGSMSGIRPLTKVMGYSAAKAAIDNFTKWLATHLAPAGIRVNSMAPGFLLTDQNRFLMTDEKTGEYTPRGQKVVNNTPMARLGEPDELISAVIFLLGPGSKFVTGITVPVDGGFSAFGGV